MPNCRPSVALIALVTITSLGCSVEGVDSLFGRDDEDGPAGGRGQGGAPMQTTSGSADGGSTVTGDPSSTTDAGPGPATTTTHTTTDATTTGPTPTEPTVFCNDLPCEDGDICCYYQFTIGEDTCGQVGECPTFEGWVELRCNGPDDCPGQECCGQWTEETGWAGAECASSCNGGNKFELCFGDPSACDAGSVCTPSQALGVGYSFCDG